MILTHDGRSSVDELENVWASVQAARGTDNGWGNDDELTGEEPVESIYGTAASDSDDERTLVAAGGGINMQEWLGAMNDGGPHSVRTSLASLSIATSDAISGALLPIREAQLERLPTRVPPRQPVQTRGDVRAGVDDSDIIDDDLYSVRRSFSASSVVTSDGISSATLPNRTAQRQPIRIRVGIPPRAPAQRDTRTRQNQILRRDHPQSPPPPYSTVVPSPSGAPAPVGIQLELHKKKKRKTWYAVQVGRKCGVFSDCAYVDSLVTGVPGQYKKGFKTEDSAYEAYNEWKAQGLLQVIRLERADNQVFGPVEDAIM